MKRLLLAAALLAATISHAFSYGTIQLSLSQQFDSQGKPLSGGKLYLFGAGTTTPQSAYTDTALTLALPNPITLDASGRIPQFFLADGNIKIRLDDRTGVTVIAADNLLVIGPSSGGGGGGSSVDPTTIFATGDMKIVYGTGAITGFVRANGRTIGSATSGATERANSDAQALFQYLWGADSNLTVSGGRGADAATDWAANKTITLPDWRGRAIAGLTGMGNTNNGILANTVTNPDVLGSSGGFETSTIARANLPNVSFTNSGIAASTSINTPSASATSLSTSTIASFSAYNGASAAGNVGVQGTSNAVNTNLTNPGILAVNTSTSTSVIVGSITGSVTITNQGSAASGGSGTAFNTLAPTRLTTIYIKL